MTSNGPPRPDDLPLSGGAEDPYEGESLEEYPDWWRRNIEQFRAHGMRPYRPPRFEDGEHVTPVIRELETEFDVDITVQALNPTPRSAWQLTVDGDRVRSVPRQRTERGFTLYEISSEEFVSAVVNAVEECEDGRDDVDG